MKKLLSIVLVAAALGLNAQETANRFFYELTFKPKKEKADLEKVMTILDITPKKSYYKDYTIAAQDSIIKAKVEAMEKSGAWQDMSKSIKMPKFTYKIVKTYPEMKEQYVDQISMKKFGYDEDIKLNWKITNDKQKIGEYNTQKATTDFGGRKWTAWFSSDIPFQDGPYKFYGLPGLIVKLEDSEKNYSWELKGNKKIDNYEELSYSEKINGKYGMSNEVTPTTKEKFDKSMAAFQADPLAEYRPYMTPEMMSKPMPGSDKTVGEFIKEKEKEAKDFYSANNNPIEMAPKK